VRDAFIGSYRTETHPIAVERGACSGSSELGGNHCGALQRRLALKPGEEARLTFLLGVGPRTAGARMRGKYSVPGAVDDASRELAAHWDAKLSVFQCRTPHPGMDTMVNT